MVSLSPNLQSPRQPSVSRFIRSKDVFDNDAYLNGSKSRLSGPFSQLPKVQVAAGIIHNLLQHNIWIMIL